MELGLVLDASQSISFKNFRLIKKFCQHLVSSFEIDPDKTRVAVTLFAHEVYNESFGLNNFTTKEKLVEAIGKIKHRRGKYTKTFKGLRYLRKTQMSAQVVRSDVPKIAVVLTDGNSQK
ncbi:collagen alpha-1(XII) chain [Elysia marginata]|uniref:Collagen alpha-1(XII) chain n=1 Tax=Elysia marginata TaxID=1093978 RepID=A0AAV4HDK8_9GAST|nr:collagen alpha-1(XII) chain [Elysia marginata]